MFGLFICTVGATFHIFKPVYDDTSDGYGKKRAKDWIAGIHDNAFSFTGHPRGVLSYLGMQLGQGQD